MPAVGEGGGLGWRSDQSEVNKYYAIYGFTTFSSPGIGRAVSASSSKYCITTILVKEQSGHFAIIQAGQD